jgi:hypothetical protein
MPSHNLGPLFTGSSPLEPFSNDKTSGPLARRRRRSPALSWSNVTNIGFVLAACLGTAVSGVYFFNGGDLLQEVSAWPRELFYGRPVVATSVSSAASNEAGLNPSTAEATAEIGDPFPSAKKLLGVERASNSTASSPVRVVPPRTPFSKHDSVLQRLNLSAAGTDALSRELTGPHWSGGRQSEAEPRPGRSRN